MREVIIKSKIVGREGAIGGGKPIAFPDLSAYALRSDFIRLESSFNDFLEGDDTDNVINRWKELEAFLNNISEDYNLLAMLNGKADKATTLSGYGITDAYTKTNVDDLLKSYVTLGGTQTITGEKNFTGGLKVNNSLIYYDTEKKYWKLDGDLLVTGGVTMYGSDSSFTPSTIMDAIVVDGTTISKSGGVLKVIGGTGGGVADSVAWGNITGKPNFASVATSGKYDDLIGKPTLLSSFTDDVVSGKYLPLSGGTLDGNLTLRAATASYDSWVQFSNKEDSVVHKLGIRRPEVSFGLQYYNGSEYYKIWHEGNDGSSSGLDADLLDGQEETTFAKWKGNIAYSGEFRHIGYAYASEGWYMSGAAMSIGASSNYYMQLQGYYSATEGVRIVARYMYNGAFSSWRNIAFEDSNVASSTRIMLNYPYNQNVDYPIVFASRDNIGTAKNGDLYLDFGGRPTYNPSTNTLSVANLSGNSSSATKLQTARTIWGQSFDGSGNVDGNMIVKGQYVGITLQGTNSYNTGITFNDYEGNPRWNLSYRGLNAADKDFYIYRYTDDNSYHVAMSFIRSNGNVGIGTVSPSYKLDVNGVAKATSLYADSYVWLAPNSDAIYINNTAIAWHNSPNAWVDTLVLFARDSITLNKKTIVKGNVGIGTTTPTTSLDIKGKSMEVGESVYGSGGVGSEIYMSTHREGSTLCARGMRMYVSGSATGYFQSFAIDAKNYGTLTNIMSINSSGNLLVTGGVTMYSDQRKKTILNHVELSLKQIAEAPLIEHYYNGDEQRTTHVGSIAQYWASMNDWFCKLDSEGFYTMEIQNAALASAISIARELDRYETKTDKAIKKLKMRICELEEEIERLKSA